MTPCASVSLSIHLLTGSHYPPAIMADPTDAGISEARLRDALESVVSRRSHSYNSSHALSIKWAADDSNSAQDVGHFQAILSTLQLPAARDTPFLRPMRPLDGRY